MRGTETKRLNAISGGNECFSCEEAMPEKECHASKRSCGHHCNCSWIHDQCCWCKKTFTDEVESLDAGSERK